MLAAGAAKTVERIARHVVTACDGNFLDRLGHIGDGYFDETVGDVLRRLAAANVFRQQCEGGPHAGRVQRLALRRSKYFREKLRRQLSRHDIGVGHRQRPAAPVAHRPRIRARRIRPDPHARAIVMQNGAAAGGDRVNQHHRRAHAHAGDFGLESALILAVEMCDIGRCAAHVETDDAFEAGAASRLRHGDDAARRAGEDRILAGKKRRVGQAARRHHEHQPRAGALGVQRV